MEQRKSDRVAKRGEPVSCSEALSPDEKSEAGDGAEVITVKIPALDKYNLRVKSIQSRIELEKKKKTPVKKQPKAKQRPVPLSKYRRRTANARERTRMQEINDAFRELRSVIPELPEDADERSDEYSDNAASCTSKLTKITTLRLAVNYIAALSDILKQTDPPSAMASHDSCLTSGPPPLAATQDDVLTSISLDLELDTLNSGDFTLTGSPDDVREAALRLLIEHSFGRSHSSDARPASGNSFDLPSYHSPSTTTETESIESLAGSSGWEFASTEESSLGDVCENFDLMLESGVGDAASY